MRAAEERTISVPRTIQRDGAIRLRATAIFAWVGRAARRIVAVLPFLADARMVLLRAVLRFMDRVALPTDIHDLTDDRRQ
jgi:hypothetical protein